MSNITHFNKYLSPQGEHSLKFGNANICYINIFLEIVHLYYKRVKPQKRLTNGINVQVFVRLIFFQIT